MDQPWLTAKSLSVYGFVLEKFLRHRYGIDIIFPAFTDWTGGLCERVDKWGDW
jgi:hypothetical protein